MPMENAMSVQRLSACLYEEKLLLEELLFKLEEEQLILVSGRHRWLERATAEVENVLRTINSMESTRIDIMVGVAEELGLDAGAQATMSEVAEAVGEPWSEVLLGSRESMKSLMSQITRMIAGNRDLITRGLASTTELLVALGVSAGVAYGPDGESKPVAGLAKLVDASI